MNKEQSQKALHSQCLILCPPLSPFLIHTYTHTHMNSLIPPLYCIVNTMRSEPVMREARAVLITHSGSEDLCQSLRAHFIQPQTLPQCPLVYPFISFLFTSYCMSILEVILCTVPPTSLFFCVLRFRPTAMYQSLYLCKSTCCENEACLISWTLLDFMPFLPGNGRIMKM